MFRRFALLNATARWATYFLFVYALPGRARGVKKNDDGPALASLFSRTLPAPLCRTPLACAIYLSNLRRDIKRHISDGASHHIASAPALGRCNVAAQLRTRTPPTALLFDAFYLRAGAFALTRIFSTARTCAQHASCRLRF